MATYLNNLRLKEIATGDESGTWGVSTNTNLELITDGFSYGTKEIAADANETFTMPDATADATRGFYLKFTSGVSLTATRTVTLGPNTVSKTWIIENATTGSQIITIKQGSGATVNVANGSKVMIVTDGAGAGAAVLNANPTEIGGTVTSVGGTGTVQGLTLSGTVTSSGNLTLGGSLSDVDLTSQVTGTLPVANGGTGSTTASGALTNFGLTATAAEINTLDGITATTTELNYTDGVTSNIQTQLNAKGVGSVTSVGTTGTVQGLTLSGTVTSSGNLTLGGSLSDVNLASQVTGTLPVANGGTGSTSLTANNVILGNGTGAVQAVAPSTSGNVLTSNGTTWVSSAPAGGGGAMEYIAETDITSSVSSVILDNAAFSSSDYDHLIISIKDLTLVSGTSQALKFQWRVGGSDQTAANYDYVGDNIGSNRTAGTLSLSYGSTDRQWSGIIKIYHLTDGYPSQSQILLAASAGTALFSANYTTTYDAGISNINGISFSTTSGNSFDDGTITLYGVKNS